MSIEGKDSRMSSTNELMDEIKKLVDGQQEPAIKVIAAAILDMDERLKNQFKNDRDIVRTLDEMDRKIERSGGLAQ